MKKKVIITSYITLNGETEIIYKKKANYILKLTIKFINKYKKKDP